YLDWKLAVMVFFLLPFKFLCFQFFNPKIKESSLQMQRRLADMSGDVHEKLSGINIVQAFNAERQEHRKFRTGNIELYEEQISNAKFSAVFHSLFHVLIVIASMLVFWVGAVRVLWSLKLQAETGVSAQVLGLSPGELVTFLMLLPQFQTPLTRFADLN